MENKVNYAAVGLFVIVLISAITLSIIWLSSGFSFQNYKTYLVFMTESVSGLTLDSPVEFNGVNVGSVKKIDIDENNPQRVKVVLSILNTTPVTRGTVATLNSRGLTGLTFMALKDPGVDQRPLLPLPGNRDPIIPTSPSLFMRIDTALNSASKNFQEVTKTLQAVFDKDNQVSIKVTLHHLKQLTRELIKTNERLSGVLLNTERASRQFEPLLNSGISTIRTLEMQTLPATYRILTNLEEISRNLGSVTTEIKQNPAILVRGVTPSPLGPGER